MGTLTLVLCGAALAVVAAVLVLGRRKPAREPQSGGPIPSDGVLRMISGRLTGELALPGKEFRQEMGTLYPDLAMAFRQSMNFGLMRYAAEKMNCPLNEEHMPDIINRLLCEYYGFILPRDFSPEDLASALRAYYKQKKILRKVSIADGALTIDQERYEIPHDFLYAGARKAALISEVFAYHLARMDSPDQPVQSDFALRLFRETGDEIGYVLVSPTQFRTLAEYAMLQAMPAGNK